MGSRPSENTNEIYQFENRIRIGALVIYMIDHPGGRSWRGGFSLPNTF